jgi:hypothetical protein
VCVWEVKREEIEKNAKNKEEKLSEERERF